MIQPAHIVVKSIVDGVGAQAPVLLSFFIPFPQLPEFISHKIQFFAGVKHQIEIQRPGLWKFSIVIAVHFLEDGGLPMDIFIMREGQQIALVLKIHHGKGQFVVVGGTVLGAGPEKSRVSCIHPRSHL